MQDDLTIILKHSNLTFNDKDCHVLTFTDITTFQKLKKEQEKTRLLNVINMSVHHEMIGHLRTNIEISSRLINMCRSQNAPILLKRMA